MILQAKNQRTKIYESLDVPWHVGVLAKLSFGKLTCTRGPALVCLYWNYGEHFVCRYSEDVR